MLNLNSFPGLGAVRSFLIFKLRQGPMSSSVGLGNSIYYSYIHRINHHNHADSIIIVISQTYYFY